MARKPTKKRTAGVPKRRKAAAPGLAQRAVTATGTAIARNPTLVGGSTAFLVAMFFVSANALWYQPHLHSGAFFQTREVPSILLPPEEILAEPDMLDEEAALDVPAEPKDPLVAQVQSVLQELKLYQGPMDGLMTMDTQEAVSAYQRIVGQPMTGLVDEALLAQLGIPSSTASIAPVPSPRETAAPAVSAPERMAEGEALPKEELIRRIQAGLRAFGNEAIEIDGMMGEKTRAGIREFQSLFGLATTGEPDQSLYAKMREIGLTN